MSEHDKPPVMAEEPQDPIKPLASESSVDTAKPAVAPSVAEAAAPAAPSEAKEDGIDKLMASMGIDAKHKKFVLLAGALIVGFIVFNVFGNRQVISNASDEGAESLGGQVSVDKARGAMILLLDPELLVRAAVAQTMSSASGEVEPVETEKLGEVIRTTVKQYRDEGYVVINKSDAMAFPSSADLTPVIAAKAGIDLSYGKKDLFGGAGGISSEQAEGSERNQ